MIRRTEGLAVGAAMLAAIIPVASGLAAQATVSEPVERAIELGLGGGAFFSSDWSDLVIVGVADDGFAGQTLMRDVAVHPGGLADLSVAYRRGAYGVRAHIGYSRSCLAIGAGCVSDRPGTVGADTIAGLEEAERVRSWLYDVTAVVELGRRRPDRWFRPYLLAGVGGVTYDPGELVRTVLPTFVTVGATRGRLRPGADGRIILEPIVDAGDDLFVVAADEVGFETVFALVGGIGTELRWPWGDSGAVGLMIEATDHLADSPLDASVVRFRRDFDIAFRELELEGGAAADTIDLDFGFVHNVRVVVGLKIAFPLDGPRPARLVRNENNRTLRRKERRVP